MPVAVSKPHDRTREKILALAKSKGVWKYESGEITDAEVNYKDNFDKTVFNVEEPRCHLNCGKVSGLKGQPLIGDATAISARLKWLDIEVQVEVKNQLISSASIPTAMSW